MARQRFATLNFSATHGLVHGWRVESSENVLLHSSPLPRPPFTVHHSPSTIPPSNVPRPQSTIQRPRSTNSPPVHHQPVHQSTAHLCTGCPRKAPESSPIRVRRRETKKSNPHATQTSPSKTKRYSITDAGLSKICPFAIYLSIVPAFVLRSAFAVLNATKAERKTMNQIKKQ